jgi:hypothetical protein
MKKPKKSRVKQYYLLKELRQWRDKLKKIDSAGRLHDAIQNCEHVRRTCLRHYSIYGSFEVTMNDGHQIKTYIDKDDSFSCRDLNMMKRMIKCLYHEIHRNYISWNRE